MTARALLLVLFAFATCAGCGDERCDIYSAAGACFHLHSSTWTADEIDATEREAVNAYAALEMDSPQSVRRATADASVDVVPGAFWCGEVWAHGCQEGFELTITDLGCPGRSALAHEYGHLWELVLHNRIDYHDEGAREPFVSLDSLEGACAGGGE